MKNSIPDASKTVTELKKVLISIIIVVYNADRVLEEAILSVINQSYGNKQLIIIDGGSQDKTVEIIKKYESEISEWISEPDAGIYDAMNKGLNLANGDWVLFLGADDILYNDDVVKSMVQKFDSNHIIYYGNALFKSTSKLYNVNISKWFLSLRNLSHQTIFYPKIIYKNYRYNLRYRLFADHIYNITIFSENKYNFVHLPITTVIYNDKGSSSEANDPNYFRELPFLVGKMLGIPYAVYVYIRFKLFMFKKFLKHRS